MLDCVVLGASEVDRAFNANVVTHSDIATNPKRQDLMESALGVKAPGPIEQRGTSR